MAKRRYSNSRKRKTRSGKKCRHTRHTKRHMRRGHRRTRRGGQTPGPPTLLTYLKQDEPLSGGMRSFQGGGGDGGCRGSGVELSTGGYAHNNGPQWYFKNSVCGQS